ncbi:MAG: hypothetical protein ABSB79_15180 [Syntrophales bacterium]|jgi:hypothetical protein
MCRYQQEILDIIYISIYVDININSEHRKMTIILINEAPEDPRNGDVSGGSYARERSSGVFNFKEGGLRGKPDIDEHQGKVRSFKFNPIMAVICGMGERKGIGKWLASQKDGADGLLIATINTARDTERL